MCSGVGDSFLFYVWVLLEGRVGFCFFFRVWSSLGLGVRVIAWGYFYCLRGGRLGV